MTITLVHGAMGSGKTLFLIMIAKEIRKRSLKTIISNFTITDIANVEQFDSSMILNENMNNKVIFIDEAYVYLDSRRSMSEMNIMFSYIVYQSRKNKNDIYLVVQKENTIDKREREFIDVWVSCNKINDVFFYSISNQFASRDIAIPVFACSKLFKHFNTYEIVSSERIEKFKADNSSVTIENLSEMYLNDYIEFKRQYNAKNSEKFVKFYLSEHKLPASKKLVESIYFACMKKESEMRNEQKNSNIKRIE